MEKTSTRKWLRIGIVLYIVVLSGVAITSFGWFIFEDTTSFQTSENYMKVISGAPFDIAITDGSYTAAPEDFKATISIANRLFDVIPDQDPEGGGGAAGDGDNQMGVDIEQSNYFVFPDITGDGEHFYYPKYVDNVDGVSVPPLVYNTENYTDITVDNREKFMVVVRVAFRCSSPTGIYLHSNSYVKPSNQDNDADVRTASATRIAFTEVKIDNQALMYRELVNVWCPNVQDKAPTDVGSLRVDETDGTMHFKPFADDLDKFLERKITWGGEQLATSGTVSMINNAPLLLEFTEEDFKDASGNMTQGFAYKYMDICIWVEGTDSQMTEDAKDGMIQYGLYFTAVDKSPCTLNNNDINVDYDNNQLTYQGNALPDGVQLQYSENGIDWKPYSNQLQFDSATSEFYVRYAETVATRAGEVKRFSKSAN